MSVLVMTPEITDRSTIYSTACWGQEASQPQPKLVINLTQCAFPYPFNSSSSGQNGPPFRRRHFETHFLEWKVRLAIIDKPLSEPMLTLFTCAYMRHYRERCVKVSSRCRKLTFQPTVAHNSARTPWPWSTHTRTHILTHDAIITSFWCNNDAIVA